jgi:dTDP-glucose 4,6-dehydratase
MIGRDVEITSDAQRVRPDRSEVQQLWADASRAAEVIGWKPQVGFDEGLRRTIDWIKSHLELYQVGQYQV